MHKYLDNFGFGFMAGVLITGTLLLFIVRGAVRKANRGLVSIIHIIGYR